MVTLVLVCIVIGMICYPLAFIACNQDRSKRHVELTTIENRKKQLERVQLERDRNVVMLDDLTAFRSVSINTQTTSLTSETIL
jgi:hypothetical protein